MTVPAVVLPSPQLIFAVKSAVVAPGLASVKLATEPLMFRSDITGVAQLAVSAASPTVAVDVVDPSLAELLLSVSVVVTVLEPSSAYVWVPSMLYGPPVGPLTVPAVVLPSPQSTEAENSEAVAEELLSVKDATSPEKLLPSVAETAVPLSVTVAPLTVTSIGAIRIRPVRRLLYRGIASQFSRNRSSRPGR